MRRSLMHGILRNLEWRIAQLESCAVAQLIPGLAWIQPLDAELRNAMAPNERIVEDIYEDEEGHPLMISERITSDSSDLGWSYPHGAWDRSHVPLKASAPEGLRIMKARPPRMESCGKQAAKISDPPK